jgi:hypothetical protein
MAVKRASDRIDVSTTLQRCCGNRVERLVQLNPIQRGETKKGRFSRVF